MKSLLLLFVFAVSARAVEDVTDKMGDCRWHSGPTWFAVGFKVPHDNVIAYAKYQQQLDIKKKESEEKEIKDRQESSRKKDNSDESKNPAVLPLKPVEYPAQFAPVKQVRINFENKEVKK